MTCHDTIYVIYIYSTWLCRLHGWIIGVTSESNIEHNVGMFHFVQGREINDVSMVVSQQMISIPNLVDQNKSKPNLCSEILNFHEWNPPVHSIRNCWCTFFSLLFSRCSAILASSCASLCLVNGAVSVGSIGLSWWGDIFKRCDIWVWVNTYRYISSGLFTSIYQLFWGSPGTRVLTHPHFWHFWHFWHLWDPEPNLFRADCKPSRKISILRADQMLWDGQFCSFATHLFRLKEVEILCVHDIYIYTTKVSLYFQGASWLTVSLV